MQYALTKNKRNSFRCASKCDPITVCNQLAGACRVVIEKSTHFAAAGARLGGHEEFAAILVRDALYVHTMPEQDLLEICFPPACVVERTR